MMSNLRSIKESILTMSAEQVMDIHRAIRQSRRTPKKIVKKIMSKKKDPISTSINSMSDADLARLEAAIKERMGK